MYASFGMLMEVREFVRGHVGRDFQGSGERTQCYEEIKLNNGTGF